MRNSRGIKHSTSSAEQTGLFLIFLRVHRKAKPAGEFDFYKGVEGVLQKILV